MRALTRRGLLAGTAAAGGLAALPALPARAAERVPAAPRIAPGDGRYGDLVRGGNLRFVGAPDYVAVVSSTAQVVREVQQAIQGGRRVTVRSGGHCYENFVADPAVQVVIDLAGLNRVSYDAGMRAFAVEAGATLGDVYRTLYKGWGVAPPAGNCPTVGAGGHIPGGGYGSLSRQYGLVVDHLYAIEVVVVDASGTARAVVAARDSADAALRDLWWAHTGGGGGNFGIVTRFWLRSPGATGDDPATLLPRPPAQLTVSTAAWSWNGLTRGDFDRIVRNYCGWYERNSSPSSPYLGLAGQLKLAHQATGSIGLATTVDATRPDSAAVLDGYYTALTDGVGVPLQVTERRTLPWWHASWWNGFNGGDSPLTLRFKAGSAYLKKTYRQAQLDGLYASLTATGENPATAALLAGYGGRINAVDPAATAVASRDSIIKVQYATFWTDEADDDRNVDWLRRFYRDVHADTGGVPILDDVTDGAFINYVDADLADPAWNTSGVGWQTLYYGANYPRLRQVKTAWDPGNVFRHALSIEPI